MHIDDAAAFLVDFLRTPRPDHGYSTYGYEIYLPRVVVAYLQEIERTPEYLLNSYPYSNPRAADLSPFFLEAAWDLCRRGILRPGIREFGAQATAEGASGNGYCLTTLGRHWIEEGAPAFFVADSDRLSQLFDKLKQRLGPGFLQRASEAVRCHAFGAYIGCCAMCGAAAESILLAVAIAKSGDEGATLTTYKAAGGRRKVVESVVGQARQTIADPFRSATGLLSYWRDEAAHGLASTISEIEAHEALARLLRYAQFATDNWAELTRTSPENHSD
jgi:hypothetical protein